MAEALRIAIVGAECTGKSTLARELVAILSAEGRRVAGVAEYLREWCDRHQRTPRADEQAALLREQQLRIEQAAAAGHEIVVCDTTALMTAVYSRHLFGDRSLEAEALALQRGMAATLLTALDLPWVADGHQRDGAHVREPVDTLLREALLAHALPFAVIAGQGPARLAQARAALQRQLPPPPPGQPRRGRYTRLAGAGGAQRGWACECCLPAAEQALLAARR